jgi:hypothetical protein
MRSIAGTSTAMRPAILGQMEQSIGSNQRHVSSARAMNVSRLAIGHHGRRRHRAGRLTERDQRSPHRLAQWPIRRLDRQLTGGSTNVGTVMNPDRAIRPGPIRAADRQKRIQPKMAQFVTAVAGHHDVAGRRHGDQGA